MNKIIKKLGGQHHWDLYGENDGTVGDLKRHERSVNPERLD
jgi:hypothetical protein